MVKQIEDPLLSGPCKNIKNWPQAQWKFCDTSATLCSNAISRMPDQTKRGIEYEVNSLLHGEGLVNRGSIGEVKLLRALKLGGQEGVNSLENNVPRKV